MAVFNKINDWVDYLVEDGDNITLQDGEALEIDFDQAEGLFQVA